MICEVVSKTPVPNLVSKSSMSLSLTVRRPPCSPCSVSRAVARDSTAVARPSTAFISLSRVETLPASASSSEWISLTAPVTSVATVASTVEPI